MKTGHLAAALLILATFGFGCSHRGAPTATAPPPEPTQRGTSAPEPAPKPDKQPRDEGRKGATEKGLASWYGEPYHGRRTASGEVYDMHQMTAAHRTLPFDTVVRVTRRDTGDDVTVRINDRGPFITGRIIDLSFAAAEKIGLDIDGIAPVKVVVVGSARAPDRPPRRETLPPEHPAGGTCVWIQVGAFGSIDNARRAERRLEDAGETAVIIEGPGGLHRVRVGPFDRESDALEALERIGRDWPEAAAVPCG